MADELLCWVRLRLGNKIPMKPVTHGFAHRANVTIIAALLLLSLGCAATHSAGVNNSDDFGQQGRGNAYQGQSVTVILPRQSDAPMRYRSFAYPYEPNMAGQFVQARDATQMVEAILLRELGRAGYQPRLGEFRADAGDELGVRYEVTRVWTTQLMSGMWPTPGFYRASVSARVVVLRGDLNCMAQAYFARGEGASAWSAFSRALDRLLSQSMPEVMNAVSGCGAPPAQTK